MLVLDDLKGLSRLIRYLGEKPYLIFVFYLKGTGMYFYLLNYYSDLEKNKMQQMRSIAWYTE